MVLNKLDIKEARKKHNLTQPELAKRLGVSVGTIVNWENGKPIPNSKQPILESLINNSLEQDTEETFSFEVNGQALTSKDLMENQQFKLWLISKEQAAQIKVLKALKDKQ